MGRQITVQLPDLKAAGCTFEIVPTKRFGNDPEDVVPSWVKVTLPDGRYIGSYCDDVLHFDCRSRITSANGWMEDWLIEQSIPYTAG